MKAQIEVNNSDTYMTYFHADKMYPTRLNIYSNNSTGNRAEGSKIFHILVTISLSRRHLVLHFSALEFCLNSAEYFIRRKFPYCDLYFRSEFRNVKSEKDFLSDKLCQKRVINVSRADFSYIHL